MGFLVFYQAPNIIFYTATVFPDILKEAWDKSREELGFNPLKATLYCWARWYAMAAKNANLLFEDFHGFFFFFFFFPRKIAVE